MPGDNRNELLSLYAKIEKLEKALGIAREALDRSQHRMSSKGAMSRGCSIQCPACRSKEALEQIEKELE